MTIVRFTFDPEKSDEELAAIVMVIAAEFFELPESESIEPEEVHP